jgi:hypothetical protein
MLKSQMKTMLITLFDIVPFEFIPQSQTEPSILCGDVEVVM